MTKAEAESHLANNRPQYIDSAFEFSERYRINPKTGSALLKAYGYRRKRTPDGHARWVRGQTQLDRIERKLNKLINHFGLDPRDLTDTKPILTLSDQIRQNAVSKGALRVTEAMLQEQAEKAAEA